MTKIQRPLATHRLLVEVDVLCADDHSAETLAGALSRLATAGLMGMVREVVRVELDGRAYAIGVDRDNKSIDVRPLRPPPDPRIGLAAARVAEALRGLNQVLGRASDCGVRVSRTEADVRGPADPSVVTGSLRARGSWR